MANLHKLALLLISFAVGAMAAEDSAKTPGLRGLQNCGDKSANAKSCLGHGDCCSNYCDKGAGDVYTVGICKDWA